MRYCPNCFDEYRDDVARCPSCDAPLVSRDELEKSPQFQRTRGIQVGRFVKAGAAEDPFDSEAFCDALADAGIPVLSRPRRGSPVDPLTTGTTHGWWDIMVPEDRVRDATPIIERRRMELRAAEDEAGKAAEAEELEGEQADRKGS